MPISPNSSILCFKQAIALEMKPEMRSHFLWDCFWRRAIACVILHQMRSPCCGVSQKCDRFGSTPEANHPPLHITDGNHQAIAFDDDTRDVIALNGNTVRESVLAQLNEVIAFKLCRDTKAIA